MRRLVWVIVVCAVLWGAWWTIAAWGLRSGVLSWFDARRAEGWQADVSGPELRGFPGRIVAVLDDVALADPATGVAISADTFEIEVRTVWPGDVRVLLPATPVQFATPDGRAAMQMEAGVMALELVPELRLGLDVLEWTGAAWSVDTPQGSVVLADGLRLAMVRGDQLEAYRFEVQAPGFAPGAVPRAALRVPDTWPAAFDVLQLEARVVFDRAWDMRALEDRRPQPRRIDVELAEARWGTLRLKLAAALDVDAEGVPTGTVNLQAEDWPVMLDLAVAAGLLPETAREQLEAALLRLAALGGNPDTLDLQMNLVGGFMTVGIIPVGRAPRLILR